MVCPVSLRSGLAASDQNPALKGSGSLDVKAKSSGLGQADFLEHRFLLH